MIRFDDERRQVSLSVRDLADESDYRFSGPAPLSLKRRALLGRIAHETHQGARESDIASYRRERSLRYETSVGDWRAVVTGRIDGIYTDGAGRTVIEEIKTIVGSEADLAAADEATFPAYARQLQLYRYLLEEGSKALGFEGRAPQIALHLFLIALPSRTERTIQLSYDRATCQELVQRRLLEVIENRQRTVDLESRRKAVRQRIRFPHEPRQHQLDMVDAIEEALENSGQILVSAPPGIGKTAAALIPALRRAASLGGQVFVATSKTTQQEIFAKTLRLIRETGAPIRSVVLTAKSKACLNDAIHCHPDACQYAADYERKLHDSGALPRLLELAVADREALRSEAAEHRFCPVEAAFDLSREVDVVVGDFNYVFDPGAVLKRMFVEGDPRNVVLVIDEAHNLYDRGMAYYSPELRRDVLRQLEQLLVGAREPVQRRVRALLRVLLQHLDEIERGGGAPAPEPVDPDASSENMLLFDDPHAKARQRRKSGRVRGRGSGRLRRVTAQVPAKPARAPAPAGAPPEPLPPQREVTLDLDFFADLRDDLNELSVAWFAEGRPGGQTTEQDPVLALNRLVSRFVGVLELGGPEFSTIFRRQDGGSLKILCKDPSRQLSRRLGSCGGVVAVSATLEPLEFYRDVLGFAPDAVARSFPSPFDTSRRKVCVLDLPSTTYGNRDRDLPIVEDAVRAVVASHRGNYLVCCPSFSYLEKLAVRLDGLPGFELLRQKRYMPDASRVEMLERLRRVESDGLEPVVLLVVHGGIFTEGVDYPGQDCVGMVVIGPGLPAVSYERELIQGYYQEIYRRGFEYAFLYPGMNKVIQAAGRVIRTPTDKGVVVLVGSRFGTQRYSSLFPRDWYERNPRELVCLNPYEELRRFWSGAT